MGLSVVGTGSAMAALVLYGWLTAGAVFVGLLGLLWAIVTALVARQPHEATPPAMPARERPLAAAAAARALLSRPDRPFSGSR